MAAYAALVSLMNLIEQIQNHPQPPVTLDKEQAESLKKRIVYFQEFLEIYNSYYAKQEMEQLRNSIADAAYAAEDFIESCVFNQIVGQSTIHDGQNFISLRDFIEGDSRGCSNSLQAKISSFPLYRAIQKLIEHMNFLKKEGCSRGHSNSLQSQIADQLLDQVRTEDEAKISSIHLYQALQKVIEHMDFLKEEVMMIKDRIGTQDQRQSIATPPVVSSSSPSMKEKTMVGNDDVLREILDKLTGQPCGRQIISISGMGGIGKTTLARNIYRNQLIVEHFDICSWVTISQEYNIREILLEVLCQTHQGSRESLSRMTDEGLGEKLYKSLYGRRYLIIMDDVWSHKVCDKVKFLFPDNGNGSRILITTRLSKLAQDLSGSYGIKVDFLDQDKSWSLLCRTVFGEEDNCPLELTDIGMMIAKNCKGLPLSIVVIGGLLAKFKHAQGYWEYVAENISSNLNLEENEGCLNILYTSYKQLPVPLKACFLYIGIFPEDTKIRVSKLIKLWAAEGFLKPLRDKNLEEIAEEYLKDLIDRNLVMVSERGSSGKLKYCNIHDLIRDLCLRQAQKEKFLSLASENCLSTSHEGINTKRRIAIHESTSMEKTLGSLESELAIRSLTGYYVEDLSFVKKFRLLRVLNESRMHGDRRSSYSLEDFFELSNLRYLGVFSKNFPVSGSNPSSISLWNLQTLIIPKACNNRVVPPEIWKMHHLRHVKFSYPHVLDPPNLSQTEGQNDIVLENLQTLAGIKNFMCSEEMVKRIPNVKKLIIAYDNCKPGFASDHCLNNLVLLHKLESLRFESMWRPCRDDLLHNLSFPSSLKKLTLQGTCLYWEDINTEIGSLPLLQVLKLKSHSIIGPEWGTIEGKFPNLKYLLIENCTDLECWTAESIHFPRLEHLVLKGLGKLKEIPSGVGEIPTLQSIHLDDCSDSVIISAKQILDEQEDLGNEGLHVRVLLGIFQDKHLKSLASHNFQVETYHYNSLRAQALVSKAALQFIDGIA